MTGMSIELSFLVLPIWSFVAAVAWTVGRAVGGALIEMVSQ